MIGKLSSAVAIVALGSAACGQEVSDRGTGSGGGGTHGAGTGGSVAGNTVTLTLEAFDVQPGTERQVCKVVNLPVDRDFYVSRFHSTMVGLSHHFNLYKTLVAPTELATEGETEVHDCGPASEQLTGRSAYIFGSATAERTVDMLPGVAFRLLPQHRIVLEQHVINAGTSVVQGGVTLELQQLADPSEIEHYADAIWFANWLFSIPPKQEFSATTHCTVPYAVEVFGLMSHTHGLGTHFSIEKWTPSKTEHFYDSTDWSHPLYQPHDPPFALAQGEGLEWTCTWTNGTAKTVNPGKESTDEMCMTFAYAYPKDTLEADPIQCNQY